MDRMGGGVCRDGPRRYRMAKRQAADRVRQRARGTLDEAEASLRAAQLELVRVSGLVRAAILLDVPVDKLRSPRRPSDKAASS